MPDSKPLGQLVCSCPYPDPTFEDRHRACPLHGDEPRAQMVFATVGHGIHPDEALVCLADLLDIEYQPGRYVGRERVRLTWDVPKLWEKIEREFRRLHQR